LPRLFISHSNKDSIHALAFQRWLELKGRSRDDVFIDLHDMQAGERWRETLVKANVALTPDQRHALEMLAGSAHGCTEATLRTHDFGVRLLTGLVRAKLAVATPEHVKADGRTLSFVRVEIAEAGRRASGGRWPCRHHRPVQLRSLCVLQDVIPLLTWPRSGGVFRSLTWST
jgi:hypothetical protein